MVEYHEAFWVAAAAAAPVIGLAHAITVQEAMENPEGRIAVLVAGVLATLALVADVAVLLFALDSLLNERDPSRGAMKADMYLLVGSFVALVYTGVFSRFRLTRAGRK